MFEKHAAIHTPKEEVNIWRYMSVDKFLFLVSRSKLYFCRSDKFKDPWEGQWPKGIVEALRSGKFAETYSENAGKQILNWSEKQKMSMFINCWYSNPHESAAMWELYSAGENSIAIRSTIGRLKKGIVCDECFYIGDVKYIDYEKEVIEGLNMFLPFFIKRKSFEHENEVRVLISSLPIKNKKVNWSKAKKEIIAKVELTTLISEVYVSPSAPSWMKNVIKDVLVKFGLASKKVHQSHLYEPCVY